MLFRSGPASRTLLSKKNWLQTWCVPKGGRFKTDFGFPYIVFQNAAQLAWETVPGGPDLDETRTLAALEVAACQLKLTAYADLAASFMSRLLSIASKKVIFCFLFLFFF